MNIVKREPDMKRLFLLLILTTLYSVNSYTQNRTAVDLVRVNPDSLKNYVEKVSDYKLFFTEYNENERFSISLSTGSIVEDLKRQMISYSYFVTEKNGYIYILKSVGIVTSVSRDLFSSESQGIKNNSDLDIVYALSNSNDNVASSENKIYVIGNPSVKNNNKTAILSGYIRSAGSGEPVMDAIIMVESSTISAHSDETGYYRIALPLGDVKLVLRAYSMREIDLTLEVYENGTLDINMSEIVYSLSGVKITANRSNNVRSTKMGIEKIHIDKIKKIPAVFGEADVVKVLLTLPGVKTVGETSGGFNVRGGASDQNLILFNGGTIYNPTHLFGMFSSFNPDIVSGVELYKSAIPAKLGGRISSVLEVTSRNGNTNKITGSAGIGLLTGKVHLEGPLSPKTTFITGVRSSYSNWILRMLPKESGYNNGTADFIDGTLGVTHRFNEKNSLQLFGYYSKDGFSFSRDTSYRYANMNFSLKWKNIITDRMNMSVIAGMDRYDHRIQEIGNAINAYKMSFDIGQYYAKIDMDNMLSENNTLSYGANFVMYDTHPGKYLPVGEESMVVPRELQNEKGVEMALYVGDAWNITPKLSLDMGVRYSFYSAIGPYSYAKYSGDIRNEDTMTEEVFVGKGKLVKPYHGPEFRVSMKYDIDQNTIFKAGFNTMRQYIHMISNTAAAAPTDIWKISDHNLQPQSGWQAAAGLFRVADIGGEQIDISVEGYYKRMFKYLDYTSGAQINMNQYIERDVINTTGKAYGAELLIRKESGKLNGWLGYSYSRTLLKEEGEKDYYSINRGEWYPASYDKPHDLKLVANYKVSHRFSMSLNVDYATGRPITIPVRVYRYSNGYKLQYSDRNSYRIPDYFRVDFSINIEPSHYLPQLTHSSITIGVYNLTGRKNAFSVFYETDGGRSIKGYMLSIFGAPIPYITYNIKF